MLLTVRLQSHYCLASSLEVACIYCVTVCNLSVAVDAASCLTEKIVFKGNEASVARNVLAVAHFI